VTHRSLGSEEYCYLTTTGRASGLPREIEIWFALLGRTVYLLSGGGGRAHWVRNLRRQPQAVVRIGDQAFEVTAREPPPGEEASRARDALFDKYSRPGSDRTRWRDHGLLVGLDLV
jgi:deazaflavin-dependent oxidoreductase (nitroreductase family)